ncbi:phage tail tape measure protein [Thermus tengchongensis]|uniref:Phage tail tape measure protein n=1 Tax=Thermus tengchongensis TaxID=1214928 RepID=A0ABY2KBS7_9DEIN|nr:phage tail tape measure protein [Thermus tengchongensis]TFU17580.1 phage tail tape measure protein [Thermus tengchongensis]
MNALFRLQVMLDLVDRMTGPLGRVGEGLRKVEELSHRADLALQRLGAGLSVAGAGAALAAPLVLATRAAMDFEDAFADVRKVVDAPAPALMALQRELLGLTRVIPMTARELTEIAAAAGQAGIPMQELVRFTQDAARVGVAFGISAGQAGDALAKLRNVLELSQEGVMRLADAVNHLSNNMAATAPEILEVLRRVGGTGKLLGLTGQQVAAFSASLLALGTAPEVAATGLNALFQRLATAPAQPKAFQEALGRLGLTATGLQQALRRDAAGAIMDFLHRLRAVPDQLTVLSDLFGMEYADDIAKLVGSLGTLEKAFSLVRSPAAYTGSVLAEFQNRSATLRNQLILLRNALERIWITLGNALLPVVTPVVARLADLLNRVSDLLDRFPLLRGALVAVTATLGGLLVVGGFLVTGLAALGFAATQARLGLLALQSGLAGALRQARLLSLGLALLRGEMARLGAVGLLRGAFGLLAQGAFRAGQAVLFLGRALLLNPVGLVLGALAGLVYLFRQAWGASESFRKSVLGTLQAVRSAFAPVLAEFRGLGEALAGLFRPLGGAIQASLASAQAAWDRFGYALGYGIGFLFGLLEALVVRLAPIFADGLAGLIRILRGFVDLVVGLFTLDLDRARQGALRVWEGLRAVLSVPIRVGGVLVDTALNALARLWQVASERFPALARLGEGLGAAWRGLVTGAEAVFRLLQTVVLSGIGALRALLQGDFRLALAFAERGWQALKALLSLPLRLGGLLWDALRGGFSQVLAFARQGLASLGGLLALPLRLGGVVWDALRGGLSQALSFVRSLASLFMEAGRAIVQGLTQGIKALALAPVNAVREIGGQALATLKRLLGIRSPSRVFMGLGAMTALGLAVGLQNMAPAVQEAARALVPALEVPAPRIPELPRVPAPTVEVPRVPVPEVPAPRIPELPRVPVVAVPQAPTLEAPALTAPEPPAPSPAPERRGERPVVQVRIERVELPGVRDAEEFVEALKRLFLPYVEEV